MVIGGMGIGGLGLHLGVVGDDGGEGVSASEMMVQMEVLAKSVFVVRPCNKMKKNH